MTDYSIGFVRYENKQEQDDSQRVVWEFDWGKDGLDTLEHHPLLENRYFTTPGLHHQGMFMATPQQLMAWKTRLPDCHFHRVERREGWHRERISGAMDLYDPEYCNVTQLLPMDAFEDLLIHHMPNKNHGRMPQNVISTRELHKRRQRSVQQQNPTGPNPTVRVDEKGNYDGIHMFSDERNKTKSMHFDLTEYGVYVSSGGRLTEEQLALPAEDSDDDDDDSESSKEET